RAGSPLPGASSIQAVQYKYGFESGKAFLINSTRGSAPSPTITSTTSKRKSISGFSSIRSHASAPREIRFCFAVHRFQWPAEIFAGPRFYFHKNERVIVTAYDVDFAATASAEVAEQNFVTATL